MSVSPIPKVLSTFHRRRVRALQIGGPTCILYGAMEFTRDVDFAVAVAPGTLVRLRTAIEELEVEPAILRRQEEDRERELDRRFGLS